MKKSGYSLLLLATAAVFFTMGLFFTRILSPGILSGDPSECVDAEPFMEFLRNFNDDLQFQKDRTSFPLMYVTTSDTDPNVCDTFLIEKHQWTPLSVLDSSNYIVQVIPQQKENLGALTSCQMKVLVMGSKSDEKLLFSFIVENERWRLTTFEDYSL
jgi:hypothetical protein